MKKQNIILNPKNFFNNLSYNMTYIDYLYRTLYEVYYTYGVRTENLRRTLNSG